MTQKILDLSGWRVGSLMVIAPDGKLYGRTAWRCACDCGSITIVASSSLARGISSSCGCKKKAANSARAVKVLAGARFGRLLVGDRAGSLRRKATWNCLCDCGNETVVVGQKLLSGWTSSCGCARVDLPKLTSERARKTGAVSASTRRARLRGSSGTHTAAEVDALYAKQRGCCANCRAPLNGAFHRDHRRALADGGTNDIGNIELLCGPCNLRKHAKDPILWAQENGRLI